MSRVGVEFDCAHAESEIQGGESVYENINTHPPTHTPPPPPEPIQPAAEEMRLLARRKGVPVRVGMPVALALVARGRGTNTRARQEKCTQTRRRHSAHKTLSNQDGNRFAQRSRTDTRSSGRVKNTVQARENDAGNGNTQREAKYKKKMCVRVCSCVSVCVREGEL